MHRMRPLSSNVSKWSDTDRSWVSLMTGDLSTDESYTYKYAFEPQEKTITIHCVDDAGATLKADYTANVKYDAPYNVAGQMGDTLDANDKHYHKNSITNSAVSGMVPDDIVITDVYAPDADNMDIPDKYETSATYKIGHGTCWFSTRSIRLLPMLCSTSST